MKRDEYWDDMKAISKEKFDHDRAMFMEHAKAQDDGGWTKHTPHHWSRNLAGHKLNYWPSRNKFQYRGKVRRGDVFALIRVIEARELLKGGGA